MNKYKTLSKIKNESLMSYKQYNIKITIILCCIQVLLNRQGNNNYISLIKTVSKALSETNPMVPIILLLTGLTKLSLRTP